MRPPRLPQVWTARSQQVSPSTPPGVNPPETQFSPAQREEEQARGPAARPGPQLRTWSAPVRPHPPPGRPQDPPHAVSDSTTVPAAEPRAATPPWSPGHSRRCAGERAAPSPGPTFQPGGSRRTLLHTASRNLRGRRSAPGQATSGRRAPEGRGFASPQELLGWRRRPAKPGRECSRPNARAPETRPARARGAGARRGT